MVILMHSQKSSKQTSLLPHPYLLSGHIGLNDIDDSFPEI